jgi:hypothetical protein
MKKNIYQRSFKILTKFDLMPSRDLSVNYKIEFRCAWQTNKQTKNCVKHCKEGKKQKIFCLEILG